MPGTFTVDQRQTFAVVVFMGSSPRTKFGQPDVQDATAAGLPKWEVQAAVTFLADPGQRPVTDTLSVTIPATADPGAGLPPGTPVEFDGFRLGVSVPEAREAGKGIRGGKPWYQAGAMRPLNGHRQPAKEG